MVETMRRRLLLSGPLAAMAAGLPGPVRATATNVGTDVYAYPDTRSLVSYVETAADAIVRNGEREFLTLAAPRSISVDRDFYYFAYRLDGTCVFHGAEPALVGRNMMGQRDLNGKPVIRLITDIGRTPDPRASGWVFYMWEHRVELTPSWKGAYIRKVVLGGNDVPILVGAGLYDLKMERPIAKAAVDAAAVMVRQMGRTAFPALLDPASPLTLPDTYILVLDRDGRTLVDPALPELPGGRDLFFYQDYSGTFVIRRALAALATADDVWLQYLGPSTGSQPSVRKALYMRKVPAPKETLIVGATYPLATPIWMRG